MQRKVLRRGGLDLLEGFIKRQWVWDQKVDGKVPWDVAGGPVVHTEGVFLDFLLRAAGSSWAGGVDLFFISSGLLSVEGCVRRRF